MGEEPLIVYIHPITDTGLICWIVMNCVIYLGLSDLPFGPIWETRLRITLPAIIASFRTMVTDRWDGRFDAFELFGIDLVVYVNPWPGSGRRSMSMGGMWHSI